LATRRTAFVAARKSAGYTQESLAAALHVDRSTVIRWESGEYAPVPYLRPKLGRLLDKAPDQLRELIDHASVEPRTELGANVEMACTWLDTHAGWQFGTARRKLIADLEGSDAAKIRARDSRRSTVGRRDITAALQQYYGSKAPWYRAEYDDIQTTIAIAAHNDWLNLDFALTRDTDLLSLAHTTTENPFQLDETAANEAIGRLIDAVVLNVTIVNMPLYRLVELNVESRKIAGSVKVVPFVQYALTTDLLETELADFLAGSTNRQSIGNGNLLPMRDRYLPASSSVFDLPRRSCSGGVLALCAIARPADRHRGPADYVLLAQERGRRVLNGAGRLSVIPRGFHQPLTDFRADAPISSTLRRELEEELFHRVDVDNTLSEGRIADPMHPSRLSEPMRWLMEDADRVRFEATGFGINLVNGNFEYTCLTVIDDPEFWTRYGGQIEANWESAGLRQYSSKDRDGIRELIHDEAWSGEGLFAFLQGLKRLQQIGDRQRVAPMRIKVGIMD
jgi:DNA-binding XRE family transcriptional regulator